MPCLNTCRIVQHEQYTVNSRHVKSHGERNGVGDIDKFELLSFIKILNNLKLFRYFILIYIYPYP